MKGIDCFSPIPSSTASCMKSNGIAFAARYYCPLGVSSKLLTKSEAQDLINAGIEVVVVYDWGGTNPSHFTYDNGYNDGLEAISRAESLGQPYNSAIYFAVDTDMRYQLTAISNYFHGVSDAMLEYQNMNGDKWYIGIYGGYDVVKYMDNKWGVTHIWQTKSWSEDRIYSGNNIYQYDIFIKDSNEIVLCGHDIDKDSSLGNTGGFSSFTS